MATMASVAGGLPVVGPPVPVLSTPPDPIVAEPEPMVAEAEPESALALPRVPWLVAFSVVAEVSSMPPEPRDVSPLPASPDTVSSPPHAPTLRAKRAKERERDSKRRMSETPSVQRGGRPPPT